jgi:NAD(P)-dependent dehydrogenase (short-subunit alcohol dehydrogenase family)
MRLSGKVALVSGGTYGIGATTSDLGVLEPGTGAQEQS